LNDSPAATRYRKTAQVGDPSKTVLDATSSEKALSVSGRVVGAQGEVRGSSYPAMPRGSWWGLVLCVLFLLAGVVVLEVVQ